MPHIGMFTQYAKCWALSPAIEDSMPLERHHNGSTEYEILMLHKCMQASSACHMLVYAGVMQASAQKQASVWISL